MPMDPGMEVAWGPIALGRMLNDLSSGVGAMCFAERIFLCFSTGVIPLEYLDGFTMSVAPRFASFCEEGRMVSRFIPELRL
jgi:hypothetical protein